jgi:hypothetical protein
MRYHTEWLKRVVDHKRLHFFNVKEGWAPLCKILNVPVPDEPFPRVNEADAMKELEKLIMLQVKMRWGGIFGIVLAVVVGVILAKW